MAALDFLPLIAADLIFFAALAGRGAAVPRASDFPARALTEGFAFAGWMDPALADAGRVALALEAFPASAALAFAAALRALFGFAGIAAVFAAGAALRAEASEFFLRSATRAALALRLAAVSTGALTERAADFEPDLRICVCFTGRAGLFAVSSFDGLTVFLADLIGAPFHVPLWRRNDTSSADRESAAHRFHEKA